VDFQLRLHASYSLKFEPVRAKGNDFIGGKSRFTVKNQQTVCWWEAVNRSM